MMQSQQHKWRAWLHRVVRHEGGASTVEWIALLAIVLVALGLAAFALNENGQIGEGFVAQVECAFETVEIDGEGSDCGQVEDEDDGGCGAWPPWRWFACIAEAFEWLWEEVIQPVVEFVINELTALWKIAEGFIAFLTNPSLEGLLGIIDGACSSLIVSSLPVVGSVCDVKNLIESSMEGDVLGIVLSALSLFVEGVLSLVGMGAVAGNVMDMITNLIGVTARHGDEVADVGGDVARHGNGTPNGNGTPDGNGTPGHRTDGETEEAPRENYYDDNPLCDRISYMGRVRGLAAPIDCDWEDLDTPMDVDGPDTSGDRPDTPMGGDGPAVPPTGDGSDTPMGGDGPDTSGDRPDTPMGGDGPAVPPTGDGSDTPMDVDGPDTSGDRPDTPMGGDGPDTSGDRPDTPMGGDGSDTPMGGDGSDTPMGGDGSDTPMGGDGSDTPMDVDGPGSHHIPEVSDEWRHGVEEHNRPYIEHFAQSHGMTPEQYKAAVDQHITELVNNADIYKRMNEEHLQAILQEGRFKTVFETGTSGGTKNLGVRNNTEVNALGFDPNLPVEQRPQYGYLSEDPNGLGPNVEQYGDVTIVMKPGVDERSTLTFGDSLDSTNAGQTTTLAPQPVNDPTHRSYDYAQYGVDPLAMTSVDQFPPYVEVQMHGGLTPNDIGEVIFDTMPSPDVAARLDQQGIPWGVQP